MYQPIQYDRIYHVVSVCFSGRERVSLSIKGQVAIAGRTPESCTKGCLL